jgi:predicted O-linked N-acetylglucosamine transferase (SPINDLY family)
MPPHVSQIELALQLFSQGRLDEARALLARILRSSPADFDANNAMGVVLAKSNQHEQALFYATRAVAARPDSADALANRGNILYFLARFPEAERDFAAGVAANPTHFPSWRGWAKALIIQSRLTEAEHVCRQGLEKLPDDHDLRQVLAQVWLESGEPERAEPAYRRLASEPDAELEDFNWHAFCLNYTPGAAPADVWQAHRNYGERLRRRSLPLASRLGPPPVPAGDRLRVGILSSDLRTHSVAFFVLPLVEGLPRDRFEVFCYYSGHDHDKISHRLRSAASRWRHVWGRPHHELVRLIRSDGVHILIELNGHTAGSSLEAVALRPAPLIITAIGYPNTTGLDAVDYRLVDSITDPPAPDGTDGNLASEKLLRLDPCFLCYTPPPNAPDVANPPDPPPTFASFNAGPKLNDQVLDAWARILHQVPDSRLLLKNRALGDPGTRDRLLARFGTRGIAPHRVEALGQTPAIPEHLALYHRVDVALDTFPYCGTTTTCEAIYMGVPVITLAGPAEPGRHAWRVGASLLSAVGLSELITRSPDEYVAAAVRLAADADARREYRRTLRRRLLDSPLCDARAYADRFARALEDAWRSRR